jgi:hypothetical protein
MKDSGQTTSQCGRNGCGVCLLCCRPNCPLVTVDLELGLKRIYTRAAFVAAVRAEASRIGVDVSAIERRAREDVTSNG